MFLARRLIRILAGVVAAWIVLGILLVVLGANRQNAVASFVLSIAQWLVTPFKVLFRLKPEQLQVAVNWGVAALVYLVVGFALASLLTLVWRRLTPGRYRGSEDASDEGD